jgi:hypothetical protein
MTCRLRGRTQGSCMRAHASLNVLNQEPYVGPAPDAVALVRSLQGAVLALQSDFMSPDGSRVDYAAARRSDSFTSFAEQTRALQRVEVESLGDVTTRRCLFMNLYNVMTVQGLLCAGAELPTSPQRVRDFWNTTAYQFGSRTLTLNDIEHGILRGNGIQPASRTPHWQPTDERASLALPLEPRIHFALNCGARSCPPIRVYTPDNLEFGLRAAAASFLEAETAVLPDGTVVLSSLLNWYGTDFGHTQAEVLAYVARCLPESSAKRAALEGILQETRDAAPGVGALLWNGVVAKALPAFMPRGPVRVRFAPYDWTINSA